MTGGKGMSMVGGILVDGSVLLLNSSEEEEKVVLSDGAHHLLSKLRYSNIPTVIVYEPGLSAEQACFLERTGKMYSLSCLNISSMDDTVNGIKKVWHENGGTCLYVTSSCNEELLLKLNIQNWLIVVLRLQGPELAGLTCTSGTKSDGTNPSVLYVDKLEEVPLAICHWNRKARLDDHVTVGYIMKPSREQDFAKRGAFPWCPTNNGLMFIPLTFDLPISVQLQEIDILLHKATDEIITVEKSSSTEFFNKITYTRGMQELGRHVENRSDICIIDPLNDIFPVIDRLKTQQILLGLEEIVLEGHGNIRGPHFLKVNNFDEPDLVSRLLEAKLTLPAIVKPQIACGVPDAHNMAIVFSNQDYKGLSVPLPAVIQEYVNHSCTLFKFYVLGEKVFYAVKKSTPNSNRLRDFYEENGSKPLLFDSLKSLPTDKGDQHCGVEGSNKDENLQIELELVTNAASWLREKLNLTIFGFDVVIQENTGDHVLVDVNYLPSFKEVPDDIAIPAFWEAIKSKYKARKCRST